jgi:hypothetical protein
MQQTTDPRTSLDWMVITCSWSLIIVFGLMLCKVTRSDQPHWAPVGTYSLANMDDLSAEEQSALLQNRILYSRIVDSRTEWRYRAGDDWFYPTASSVASRRRR